MTGTREPARSSSATASMFPGVKCPARRCSIPAKGATVVSAKEPSPLLYWSTGGYTRAWNDAITPTKSNTTVLPPLTSHSVLDEQKSLKTRPTLLCLTAIVSHHSLSFMEFYVGNVWAFPYTKNPHCLYKTNTCTTLGNCIFTIHLQFALWS